MVHLSTKFIIKEEDGQIKNYKIHPHLYSEMLYNKERQTST